MFRLFRRVNKKSNIKGQTQTVTVTLDDGDDEGLALLIPDIQETSILVQRATKIDTLSGDEASGSAMARPLSQSMEQRYLEVMKTLQFGKCQCGDFEFTGSYISYILRDYRHLFCIFYILLCFF